MQEGAGAGVYVLTNWAGPGPRRESCGWRVGRPGVEVTMVRAALLTSGQLASYDHSKHLFKTHGIMQEGVPLHIVFVA